VEGSILEWRSLRLVDWELILAGRRESFTAGEKIGWDASQAVAGCMICRKAWMCAWIEGLVGEDGGRWVHAVATHPLQLSSPAGVSKKAIN
jgi:hypothetical protein